MSYLERVRERLDALDQSGRRRAIRPTSDAIDFSSNDYLGLSRDPAVLAAAAPQHVVGSGGSRLLAGAHDEHAEFECDLAAFLGRERALLFSSGYLAALGVIQGAALVTRAAYSDRNNHACIIDALRLSSLERHIYDESPPDARHETATIVSETVFSMSGRTIELDRLLSCVGAGDLLVLDEAHAIGVDGPAGAGIAAGVRDPRIVVMGTLSKAFGCSGGFVAGPAAFIDLLISTARSFIFDTSLPPSLARAARVALGLIRDGDARRARLTQHVRRLCDALPQLTARGPIVAIHIGSLAATLAASNALRARGIIAPAIRPPTVPAGNERLRVTLRADHSDSDIDRLIAGLHEVLT